MVEPLSLNFRVFRVKLVVSENLESLRYFKFSTKSQ